MRSALSILTIGVLPFLMIPLSSSFTRSRMDAERHTYRVLADGATKQVQWMNQQFLSLERAYALLTTGEENALSKPPAILSVTHGADSALIAYRRAQEQATNLRDGIDALRARLARFGQKTIHIDLSEQHATVIQGGIIIGRYPVSSGARDTPTPKGAFAISSKQKLRISNLDTPYRMPYYMAFTPSGSHGMHSLPYLGDIATGSDYWHEARSHIGTPVSHGCVRLLPEDAENMYKWVEVGTRVIIGA